MHIFRWYASISFVALWIFIDYPCFGQNTVYVTPYPNSNEDTFACPTLPFSNDQVELKRLPSAETASEISLFSGPPDEFAGEEAANDEGPPMLGGGMMGGGNQQGIGFGYTFSPCGGENGFGIHQTSLDVGFMLPTRRIPPLIISGQFGASFLDAPEVLELPSQVYLTSIGIGMPLPISERMMLLLQSNLRMSGEFSANQLQYNFMSMSVFRLSDHTTLMGGGGFKLLCDISDVDAQEFEPTVMAMGQFKRSEKLTFVAGAIYAGSDSPWPLIPMVGLNWTPREDLRVNLMMPAPRIAYRVAQLGGNEEWWAYLGGGLGGDYWYLTRPDNVVRAVRYSQFTLTLGMERQIQRTVVGCIEVGYAVGRAIEIDEENIDYELDPAFSLRLSIHR